MIAVDSWRKNVRMRALPPPRQGELEEAIEAYRSAIRTRPDFANARSNLEKVRHRRFGALLERCGEDSKSTSPHHARASGSARPDHSLAAGKDRFASPRARETPISWLGRKESPRVTTHRSVAVPPPPPRAPGKVLELQKKRGPAGAKPARAASAASAGGDGGSFEEDGEGGAVGPDGRPGAGDRKSSFLGGMIFGEVRARGGSAHPTLPAPVESETAPPRSCESRDVAPAASFARSACVGGKGWVALIVGCSRPPSQPLARVLRDVCLFFARGASSRHLRLSPPLTISCARSRRSCSSRARASPTCAPHRPRPPPNRNRVRAGLVTRAPLDACNTEGREGKEVGRTPGARAAVHLSAGGRRFAARCFEGQCPSIAGIGEARSAVRVAAVVRRDEAAGGRPTKPDSGFRTDDGQHWRMND